MQIAHNPDTGEYLGFMDGEWKPVKVARNDTTGEMLYQNADGGWEAAGGGKAPGVKQEDPGDPSWLDVPGLALKNAPASAWRLAQNMGEAIMHPMDTARAVGDVVVGLKRKGQRMFDPDLPVEPQEQAVDALAQYAKDRYGSGSGIKNTLAYDPVGALADASTFLTGGAGATKALATAGKVARLPANVVRALETANAGLGAAARATDPLAVAMRAPGAAAGAGNAIARKIGFEPPIRGSVYDAAARRIYEGALGLNAGFSDGSKARFSPAERAAIVNAGLEEGLPITPGGYNRTKGRINEINERIDNAIADADAGGVTVDPYRVAMGTMLSDARKTVQDLPTERPLNVFSNTVNGYLDFHGADHTNIANMQRGKKAIYRNRENTYKNSAQAQHNAAIEAEKEIARQQRLEIGRAVDEAHEQGLLKDKDWTSIHDLNAREGNLIGLRDAMERSLQSAAKKPLVPAFLSGVFTSAMGGDIGAGVALATAMQGMKSPWFRSQAALKLHNIAKTGLPSPMHTPAWASQYFATSMPQIEDWYRQQYGGLIGEMERSR